MMLFLYLKFRHESVIAHNSDQIFLKSAVSILSKRFRKIETDQNGDYQKLKATEVVHLFAPRLPPNPRVAHSVDGVLSVLTTRHRPVM